MQPIGNAWQKLPRLVRDLANDLGKKIELEMLGTETELDREVLELITDPLSHMVRNAADHGIETPAERRAGGKRESGRIVLRAFHDGDHIIIDISDDGRGLPIDRIRAEVARRGLATGADLEGLSPAQISRFIFAPGISTADDVTTVSGRGVGMDVVRTNVELIGGSIDVRSEAGRGSTFTIKVPLTLAIVPALIVGAAGQRFAIPQLNVTELVRAGGRSGHRIGMVGRAPVLRLRGRLVPLVRLAAVLGIEAGWPLADTGPDGDAAATGQGFIIVAHAGGQTFGMHVDAVFAAEEIVVKPTSTMLRDITVFSGNTILGDGSVIMILDPGAIARQVSGGFQNAGPAALGAAEPGSGRRRELLLIDDSPFFRDMLVPVLKSAGYAVTAVHSATEALALKRDGRAFDVIVCDLEMPGIDGFAFANRVRNDRDWKDTPLIALSCFGDGTERARGHAAGFHDLVGKFDRERLVRSVGRSLRELEDAA
jgi:two-component system chemotaxis sensor kinase CheA